MQRSAANRCFDYSQHYRPRPLISDVGPPSPSIQLQQPLIPLAGCVRTEYADFACCVLPVLRAADSRHLGGLQHGLQSSRPLYKPLSPLR
jgi:hypothetical protein